jgi:hypothetical protein
MPANFITIGARDLPGTGLFRPSVARFEFGSGLI